MWSAISNSKPNRQEYKYFFTDVSTSLDKTVSTGLLQGYISSYDVSLLVRDDDMWEGRQIELVEET